MNVLGIYDGHNCNAALVSDGVVVGAVEEERFSRVKNHDGRKTDLRGPINSISYCLELAAGQIDTIAIALEEPRELQKRALNLYFDSIRDGFQERAWCREIRGEPIDGWGLVSHPFNTQQQRIAKVFEDLKRAGSNCESAEVVFLPHHLCHHASVFFTTGWEEALIISLDGKGDNLCGLVTVGQGNDFSVRHEVNYIYSLGHLYSAVTAAIGFTAIKHEGKVTALAAYGKPNPELYNSFLELCQFDKGSLSGSLNGGLALGPYPHTLFGEHIARVRRLIEHYDRETVAATIQSLTEATVLRLAEHYLMNDSLENLQVSGGVFANVRLNQHLARSPLVKRFNVHPGMSDAGLGLGAALLASSRRFPLAPIEQKSFFLGPGYSESEMEAELRRARISFRKPKLVSLEVAKLLAENKLIGRFDGRLEYGPRALGNRSILCSAADERMLEHINRKLGRSEFMPLAPATLDEDMEIYYELIPGSELASRFMTISYTCTDRMKEQSPGAVHRDGTARPQRVTRLYEPEFHTILSLYRHLTGRSSLINTSFNLHEEPIVCTPRDAVQTFVSAELDHLQLGPFLADHPSLANAEKPPTLK